MTDPLMLAALIIAAAGFIALIALFAIALWLDRRPHDPFDDPGNWGAS